MTSPVHICDRCGRPLFKGETRYLVRIEVKSSADPLEISLADLQRDHTILREHLIEQSEAMTEEELLQDVYAQHAFAICRRCRKVWLLNPLGGSAG